MVGNSMQVTCACKAFGEMDRETEYHCPGRCKLNDSWTLTLISDSNIFHTTIRVSGSVVGNLR